MKKKFLVVALAGLLAVSATVLGLNWLSATNDVKQATVSLFEANMELGNLSRPDVLAIIADNNSSKAVALRKGYEAVWVKTAAEETYANVYNMYQRDKGNGPVHTWDSVRLAVSDWKEVSVDGNVAHAKFVSDYIFDDGGEISNDIKSEWTVTLARESASSPWKLASRTGAALEGR